MNNFVEYESTVSEFLQVLPRFISKKDKLIPPVSVIRELLNTGYLNLGMSGVFKWNCIECSDNVLKKVISELSENGFRSVQVPDWVVNREDWRIWKFEYLHNIPSDAHKMLVDKIKLLTQECTDADEASVVAFRTKKLKAELELAELINSYLGKSR